MKLRLALFTENRDLFIVLAEDLSDREEQRHSILVLRVIRNDPDHHIQYKAGDRFNVMISKVIPGAQAYKTWDLDFMADLEIAGSAAEQWAVLRN